MRLSSLRPASLALAALGIAAIEAPETATAETRLKMVLNWKYQGPQGWFMLVNALIEFAAKNRAFLLPKVGRALPMPGN